MAGKAIKQGLLYIFMIFVVLFSLFPFYWMFVLGTRTTADTSRFPPVITPGSQLFDNLQRMFDQINFWRAMGNTVFVASVITLSVLFFSSLAAFALARLNFKGRKFLFIFIVGTMMIPIQALGIVPLYIIMTKFHWIDSLKAVIFPGLVSAFGVYWMKQYMEQSIHPEIIESGRIDGCGNFRIYASLVLPVIGPGLATLGLLSFMTVWNDFVWPLIVLKSDNVITLQIVLRKLQAVYYRDNAMIFAGTFLATLPLLLIFLMFNRYFVAGATDGALKG